VEASTPVSRALTALNIPHRLFRHPGPIHSLEQAARERGQSPDQVVRSLVFRAAKDEYFMVLVAGARQVAWPTLRRYLGQSRSESARRKLEEVLDAYVDRITAEIRRRRGEMLARALPP